MALSMNQTGWNKSILILKFIGYEYKMSIWLNLGQVFVKNQKAKPKNFSLDFEGEQEM